MNTRAGKSILIFFALVAACLASAADKEVEQLLGHMRDAYKGVKSATFTTETTFDTEDGKKTLTSDYAFKAPSMIRVILKGDILPGPVTKVTDGQKISMSGPGGSAPVTDYTMDTFESGLLSNLEALSFWDYQRQLSTDDKANMHKSTFNLITDEAWDGKRWTVLEESAKSDADKNKWVWVRYFIDPKTYFIWRTVVYNDADHDKAMLDSKITEMDTDARLDDDRFKISS